ncbi:hypothetical protein [Caproicibacterium sp. XB2]|uniref:hypothetical protein n=1 Tax=Caproicibacterium sp. XB2 TaxID=3388458 RepID=UPI003850FC8C
MKSLQPVKFRLVSTVAPYTGAWIEIVAAGQVPPRQHVAPYTGAWIEIRARYTHAVNQVVAPYTGAWIEIMYQINKRVAVCSRSLHGSVD